MRLVEHALTWLSQGHPVVPIRPGTKEAACYWRQYQHTLPSQGQVRKWFEHGPYQAYGLILGRFGLTVLDFDNLALYLDWREWARGANAASLIVSEAGYQVTTGRGVHVYVLAQEEVRTRAFIGFDLKANGYVLGEESLHPMGATYTAMGNDRLILPVHVSDLLPPFLEEKGAPLSLTRQPTSQRVMPSKGKGDALSQAQHALSWEERKARAKAVPAWEVLGIPRSTIRDTGPGKGVCCCPMHDDEHPSLSCDLLTGRVSCLAGCTGRHGWDGLDAYQWLYRCDFRTAVMALTGR